MFTAIRPQPLDTAHAAVVSQLAVSANAIYWVSLRVS